MIQTAQNVWLRALPSTLHKWEKHAMSHLAWLNSPKFLRYAATIVIACLAAGSVNAAPTLDRHPTASILGADGTAKGAAPERIFSNGFEASLLPPPVLPVQGKLRFTSNTHLTPRPVGSQLESASAKLATDTDYRFLQADTSTLVRLTPSQRQYVHVVDFDRMHHAHGGDVVAPLSPVDLALDDPASSTSGCEMSDFAGFPEGHIALIQRGTCSFATKALNADNAGAVAVIVFNQGTADRLGRYFGTVSTSEETYDGRLPVVSTPFALGVEWAATPGATFRLRLDAGLRSNAWQLKPVAGEHAGLPVYWIRNAETGQLLHSAAPRQVNGATATSVELGQLAHDDPRAHWQIRSGISFSESSAVRTGTFGLTNVATGEGLTTVVAGRNNAFLVTATVDARANFICIDDPDCANWRLDNFIAPRLLDSTLGVRTPQNFTRLRSALGDHYLQTSAGVPVVDSIKPDWVNAQWILEPTGNLSIYRRIRNALTGGYLHIELGELKVGEIHDSSEAALWYPEPAARIIDSNQPSDGETIPRPTAIESPEGYVAFRNRQTEQLLFVEHGQLVIRDLPADRLAALWVRDDLSIPIPDPVLQERIQLALGRNLNDGLPPASFPILEAEAAGISEIVSNEFTPGRVIDLAGIEYLVDLQCLDLNENDVTDIRPLEGLRKLRFLNLSGNPVADISPLARNTGIADDDTVLLIPGLVHTPRYDDTDLSMLLSRRATVIPGAGQFALRDERVRRQVVEVRDGVAQFIADSETGRITSDLTNAANWEATYATDGQSTGWWIKNAGAGYMTWNAGNNRVEFRRDRPDIAEWRFSRPANADYYEITNRIVPENGNQESFLKFCPDPTQSAFIRSLRINTGIGCSVGQWALSAEVIQRTIDNATIIPSAGGFQLRDVRINNQVLDVRDGIAQFVVRDATNPTVGWETIFFQDAVLNPETGEVESVAGWWLLHRTAGYMTWNSARSAIEFTGDQRPERPEWTLFRPPGAAFAEITNQRVENTGSQENRLKICPALEQNTDLRTVHLNLASSDCPVAHWDLSTEFVLATLDESRKLKCGVIYRPPPEGFTRIIHSQTNKPLHMDNGPLEIGCPDRKSVGAQWRLIAQGWGPKFYFAIQNRLRPDQYIYRDAQTGALRTGPLPASTPRLDDVDPDPAWVQDPRNRVYLFDLDGLAEATTIKPLVAPDSNLQFEENQLRFADEIRGGSVWILDGEAQGPRPSVQIEDGFVILRTGVPPFEVSAEFEVTYRLPTAVAGQYETVGVTDDQIPTNRIVVLPWNAYDIDIKAICDLCVKRTVINITGLSRPPNVCFETRGNPLADPYYGICDPTEGQLSLFAANAAEQAACEIRGIIDFIPGVLSSIDFGRVAESLALSNFDDAREALFANGNLLPSTVLDCPPYQAMSFGAGLSVGAATFDLDTEIGVVWSLDPDSEIGASSYSSLGVPLTEVTAGFRIVSVEATSSIGFWKDRPADTQGRSYGLSLGASRDVKIDFERLKDLKKVGVSGGLTLWFACDSGEGALVSSNPACELREDSRFEGFSIDFSVGVDAGVSASFSPSVAASLSETCIPANLEDLNRICR